MPDNSLVFREAVSADLEQILHLFVTSIDGLAAQYYSDEERKAWKQGADNRERWLNRIRDQYYLLAFADEELAGMASLAGDYIDVLYVSPLAVGKAVAYQLYVRLEQEAKKNQVARITTDASFVARPFFERQGFLVLTKNENAVRGKVLINFTMEKFLHQTPRVL